MDYTNLYTRMILLTTAIKMFRTYVWYWLHKDYRDLPRLHCAQNQIQENLSSMTSKTGFMAQLLQNGENLVKIGAKNWERLEKTIIFNQLLKNDFSHAWKQIYQYVNDYCNENCIPNNHI